ncbi:MAG: hypothetical protein FWD49_05635 [Firmicutes bacterium]|nr:hypothetical protein [Bacillota bacterium]
MCITVGETHGNSTASIPAQTKPTFLPLAERWVLCCYPCFFVLPQASLPLAWGYAHFTPSGL